MSLLTATEIITQAMNQAGNTRIQSWCLERLNAILRNLYRSHDWPFLHVYDETLQTTADQAYTDYSSLTTFWKPKIVQIKVGTTLHEVTPLVGGLAAYYGNTSRLTSTGRPGKYVLDRNSSRLYWADSIPDAAETIALLYQKDVADVALDDTPDLVMHTKNGELYLINRLVADIKTRMEQYTEAAAVMGLVRDLENRMLAERMDDTDETPQEHGNAVYV